MATGHPVQELCEEVTCPICLEHFQDPMIIAECGHNFCRACLAQSWGEAVAEAPCPVCKQTVQTKSLRPNRQLANVVEIAKKLSLQERNGGAAKKEEAKERICAQHREPLKLFCQTDGILICTVCDRSKQHKHHEVLPAEEAAQEYKDKIFNCLETLRTEKEKILAYLADAEDESQEMLKITESERQKTVAEFRTLHQLLTEQENRMLAQIDEMEKEIGRKRDEHLAKLSEELSSLESLIREMEEKHQQPMSELLQDVRSTLQRYEKKETFENPKAFTSELKWRLWGCCDIGPFLESLIKKFPDNLASGLQMQKAYVTLDPTAGNAKLILSEDRRSIKCQSEAQDPPEDPEKVYCYDYVLGCERFTSGCHFWEVTVGSEGGWTVGVAREPVTGTFTFTPEEGIWAVARSGGRYKAFIKDIYPLLTLSGELKRIRISLNYHGGQVAFFDADRAALLYRFSGASFSGDSLRPFFGVYGKGYIRLSP
uniref:E3 ubiquitin-protein ligase TRIM7-like n=1 Tax=Euleptes europaea TaxID=460621 RepID=UPI002541E8DD|nr:E3 ubiquitin-protein ligase TRIM7-like [Euleptes europaea]